MKANEFITEKWSQKYKSSINCSHPKGFSQRAHCAGKKKHNEDITMEMVCEDCGMCKTHGNVMEIKKGQKDSNGYTRCWPGKHAEGTKKGKNGGPVRNCVPNEGVAEGEVVSMKDDPSTIKRLARQWWTGNPQEYAHAQQMLNRMGWDIYEDEDDIIVEKDGQEYALSMDELEAITESEAWQKANKKDRTDGMSQKAVNAYRREHPGSKLKTAVTTKPSKLKKGSKASKRRKSYCSRSRGQMKMHNISCAKTPDKAICKARRRWNCE